MHPMTDVYILSAARTPIGKFGGGLSSVPATDLGATAIRAAVERAGIAPERVDEAIMGQVLQAGAGQMPAHRSDSSRCGARSAPYTSAILPWSRRCWWRCSPEAMCC